jgi:uncharacterized membrane protein YdbT with pleckstrin-like domain
MRYQPSSIYLLRANLVTLGMIPVLYIAYGALNALGSRMAIWGVFALDLVILSIIVYHHLYLRRCSWTITEEQLIHQRGVIAIDKDYLELYRVSDYSEFSSVLDRLFGLKRIRIVSTDQSSPILIIYGIPNNIDILTPLRERVERCKRNRRIYEMANH